MFLIAFIPYILEVTIEAWFEKRKKISVSHGWTMAVRIVLMFLVGWLLVWLEATDYWWQGTALSVGIFIALFNYTYNILTGRKLTYLRKKGIDRIYEHVPIWGRIIWELCVLGSGLIIYFQPFHFI